MGCGGTQPSLGGPSRCVLTPTPTSASEERGGRAANRRRDGEQLRLDAAVDGTERKGRGRDVLGGGLHPDMSSADLQEALGHKVVGQLRAIAILAQVRQVNLL